jgi:hypothetical protein
VSIHTQLQRAADAGALAFAAEMNKIGQAAARVRAQSIAQMNASSGGMSTFPTVTSNSDSKTSPLASSPQRRLKRKETPFEFASRNNPIYSSPARSGFPAQLFVSNPSPSKHSKTPTEATIPASSSASLGWLAPPGF